MVKFRKECRSYFRISNVLHSCSDLKMIHRDCIRQSKQVQWLRLCLPVQGAWVLSLVRELRSHMACGMAKKMDKNLKWGILYKLINYGTAANFPEVRIIHILLYTVITWFVIVFSVFYIKACYKILATYSWRPILPCFGNNYFVIQISSLWELHLLRH